MPFWYHLFEPQPDEHREDRVAHRPSGGSGCGHRRLRAPHAEAEGVGAGRGSEPRSAFQLRSGALFQHDLNGFPIEKSFSFLGFPTVLPEDFKDPCQVSFLSVHGTKRGVLFQEGATAVFLGDSLTQGTAPRMWASSPFSPPLVL